jgi:hypothetical protein
MTECATGTCRPAAARQAWLLGLVVLAGCAPGKGSVSGVVRYQGKPLEAGTILFFDSRQRVREGIIGEDGKYEATDVTAGTTRVAVMTPMAITFGGQSLKPRGKAVTLPDRYANPDKSGLAFVVGRGANHWDIDLPP